MDSIRRCVKVTVDPGKRFQTIDGFGVNINSKYWDEGALVPVMETLVDDLGATLFRMDAYGNSDWIDPTGRLGPAALEKENLDRVHAGQDFRNAAAMGLWLNGRGIEPYITLSGVVPVWMRGADGKCLRDFSAFARMVAAYASWCRNEAGIRFRLFGPLNETDLGPPEGPSLSPEQFAEALEEVARVLEENGMADLRLVAAEQGRYDLGFAKAILASPLLRSRVGVIGIHAYTDFSSADLVEFVEASCGNQTVWMTEFGDLDLSGEREWYVAWSSVRRLFQLMEDGVRGAIYWDAFDNYHDHDEAWTIYGLIRNARRIFTPKRRFHALKQVYRFVRPGWVRVGAESADGSLRILAFTDPASSDISIVIMNEGQEDLALDIDIQGTIAQGPENAKVSIYRTSPEERCALVGRSTVRNANYPYTGIQAEIPAGSIVTATTLG